MMFQDTRGRTKIPGYMLLTFSATTLLLTWCSVEFVADAIKRMRARRSTPPAEPRPVGLGLWTFAVVLNFLLCWVTAGWALAPSRYRQAASFYSLAVTLLQALTIVAFDISLI